MVTNVLILLWAWLYSIYNVIWQIHTIFISEVIETNYLLLENTKNKMYSYSESPMTDKDWFMYFNKFFT